MLLVQWLLIAALALPGLSGTPPAVAQQRASAATEVTAPADAAFSTEEAFRHVAQLSDVIGSRPAGSASETAAAQYLADTFASFGYQVEQQTFQVQVYEERSARLTPLAPGEAAVDTTALLYSASDTVRGELVDVGLGRPGDWAAGELAGRVALIERGEITFADKVANVAADGALAAVIFNNAAGDFSGSLRRAAPIPVLTLDAAQGQALRARMAAEPLRVEVAVDARTGSRESRNIIATRAGRVPGAVVVGGHFDSVPAGPGANDNASGTATVVEIARVMASRDYPYTLHFIAFGAEEIGLLGSRHFVDALPEAARRGIRAMLNLDMVGVGDEWRLSGSEALVDQARDTAAAMGVQARFATTAGASSDHESFARAGVPVLFIHRTPDANYHSPRDRAEFVDPSLLGAAGGLALGVLERLAAVDR